MNRALKWLADRIIKGAYLAGYLLGIMLFLVPLAYFTGWDFGSIIAWAALLIAIERTDK